MSETVTLPADELHALRERVTSLARGSAHLKLINTMLARLSEVSGLNNVVDKILTILMDTIGGSNLIVHYVVDGRWYSQDMFGTSRTLEQPDDRLVQECIQRHVFVRSQPVVESLPYGEFSHENWAFPLITQQRLIGVVVMQGVQLADPSIQSELQPFFVYAALMLGNEISNYTVLEVAHNELMEAHQELECEIEARQDAEEHYRMIFEQSPDGVLLVDPLTRKLVSFNSAAHLQLGYTREEFSVLSVLDFNAEQSAEEIERRTRILMEQGSSTFETIHRTKDGQLRNVLVSLKIVSSDPGKPVLSIHRDFTEYKMMEQEFLKSQKLESLGVLAGGIAHDFNNLLTAIVGNIALASKSLAPDSRPATLLAASEKACLRARDLTQQLLTFAKGGAPVKKRASIAEVVQESANFALRGSGTNCTVHLPDDLWSAEVDRGQISQVIHNLVINAEQAMSGGGNIQIYCANAPVMVNGAVSEYWVRIDIQDTGIGIQPEHLKRIFDPYFTTKQKGSGLGLASSYSIVTRHRGRIEVDSTPGVGTVFHLYLPASAEPVTQEAPQADRAVCRKSRILVMDDEETVLQVVAEMLIHLGHEVERTRDGAEAIQAYRSAMATGRRFDVVVLDLTVPGGMGGKEAVKQLQQLDPEVMAVVSSGYASDTTVAEFKSYGFAAVLSKPYSLNDIEKMIAGLP